ncbi:MAG: amidohydrolase family protein [Chthoniobacteraceae bacterium]
MILRARSVIPVSAAPIADGAVVVTGNTIAAVGPFAEIRAAHTGEVTDLGEQVLMPGLVNAHCHLDYSMMRRAIQPQRSFTEWIGRINALKRSLGPDDYRAAIQRGLAELRRWGTTAVANIESFPEILNDPPASPLRTWWFLEMIDVRHQVPSEEVSGGMLAFFESCAAGRGGFGLSPHAPYTASGPLYEIVTETAKKFDMPVMTHVAESREEWEMFRHARGELYEFMLRLGRWMEDCQDGRTPLAHLFHHTGFGPRWILSHMNELDESDLTLLASIPRADRPSIVHCPGSHRYFRHAPFRLAKLLELRMNICLGTDSLASTYSLSMFDEMRILSDREQWLHPADVVAMATLNGARALGLDAGKIEPGALADLIAFPHDATMRDIHAAVIANREPVAWMMIDGQILNP